MCVRLAKEEKSGRNGKKEMNGDTVLTYNRLTSFSSLTNALHGAHDHLPVVKPGNRQTRSNEGKPALVLVAVLFTQWFQSKEPDTRVKRIF